LNRKEQINYDNQWKKLMEHLFEDFIAYFLPDLHPHIDFKYPPQFLEQELHKIITDKPKGKVINDKLYLIKLPNKNFLRL